jgi:hypothetical protein
MAFLINGRHLKPVNCLLVLLLDVMKMGETILIAINYDERSLILIGAGFENMDEHPLIPFLSLRRNVGLNINHQQVYVMTL